VVTIGWALFFECAGNPVFLFALSCGIGYILSTENEQMSRLPLIEQEWVKVRTSNLKYYDNIELFFKNPYGKIVLYKPAGMKFTDESLKEKPCLGDLYVKPDDKIRALQEAQRGFSNNFSNSIINQGTRKVKEELISIIDETLAEPRAGNLAIVPEAMEAIVAGYSRQPSVIKNLALISCTDYTTAIHSINVMALTVGYCFYTGRSRQETITIGLSALLHDVGKTEIPREILTAPRNLSNSEFQIMKEHPEIGAGILATYSSELLSALPGALEHHEKLDGSGYPKGTTDISEIGQILSIIDCYEAITNDERPYRNSMLPINALKLLKEEVDTGRFSRRIFEDFAYSLTDFSSGPHRKNIHPFLAP
jgi:HD-GYP domain-containing protein (c-di-GMP phosphodiesterase class II)